MLILPAPSLTVISTLPVGKSLQRFPDNFVLRAIVAFAAEYPSLAPDLSKPGGWAAFKAVVGERCDALKITDFYIRLYEGDEAPVRLLFQLSFADSQSKRNTFSGKVGS